MGSDAGKRAFDLVVSICGLLVLAPFFVLISLFVKVDSSGPVFYRGIRTGLGGKPFRM
ncbi:MAG: sugar transferase, partial [Thermoanaerobaculia bacterium]